MVQRIFPDFSRLLNLFLQNFQTFPDFSRLFLTTMKRIWFFQISRLIINPVLENKFGIISSKKALLRYSNFKRPPKRLLIFRCHCCLSWSFSFLFDNNCKFLELQTVVLNISKNPYIQNFQKTSALKNCMKATIREVLSKRFSMADIPISKFATVKSRYLEHPLSRTLFILN